MDVMRFVPIRPCAVARSGKGDGAFSIHHRGPV